MADPSLPAAVPAVDPAVDPAVAVVVHDDDRGRLVAVEHGDVAFPVRRSFVVSATQGAASRGGHRPGCRELLVLVSGAVRVRVAPPDGPSYDVDLVLPGDATQVDADDLVDYDLLGPDAVLLVLAEDPYAPADGPNQLHLQLHQEPLP